MDDAIKLQRAEAKVCGCGAAGSGEGHTGWCPAKRFERTPPDCTATEALAFLGLK